MIRGLSHCDTRVVSQGDKNITENITENIQRYAPTPRGDKFPEPSSPSEAPTQTSPQAEPPTPGDTPPKAKDEGAGGVGQITDSKNTGDEEGKTAERLKPLTEAEHWAKVERFFAEFWEAYPRQQGKADARAMFKRLFPPGRNVEFYDARLREIRERIEPFLENAEELTRRGERRFIPGPTKWLQREFGDGGAAD